MLCTHLPYYLLYIDQNQPTISLLPHPPPMQTQIQKPIRATTMTKSIQTKQMKGSPIPASDDKPGAETVSPTPPTPPATAEPKSTPPSKPLSKSMNMVSDSRSFQFTHQLTHTPPPSPPFKSQLPPPKQLPNPQQSRKPHPQLLPTLFLYLPPTQSSPLNKRAFLNCKNQPPPLR